MPRGCLGRMCSRCDLPIKFGNTVVREFFQGTTPIPQYQHVFNSISTPIDGQYSEQY